MVEPCPKRKSAATDNDLKMLVARNRKAVIFSYICRSMVSRLISKAKLDKNKNVETQMTKRQIKMNEPKV